MVKKLFKRNIVKDAALLSLSHFTVQLAGFFSSFLVFRYLGPTNIGLTAFLQNYLTVFATFFSGIDLYANWYIARSDAWAKKVSAYIKFKFILILSSSLLFLFIAKIFFPRDIFLLSVLSLIPLITSIFGSFIFLIQIQNRIKLQAVAIAVSALFLLLLRIVAVYLKLPVIYFIFITSLDGILLTIVAYSSLRKHLCSVPLLLSFREGLFILQKSFFAIVYVYSWFLIIKIDQLFIPLFFNFEKLGLYSSAVKVTELANVLVVLMQSLLLPRITSLYEGDRASKNTLLGLSAYIAVSVIIASLLSSFSLTWVSFLFGKGFESSSTILKVYAWTLPGIFVTNFFSVVAFSKKKYTQLAVTGMCLLAVSAPCTYIASSLGRINMVAFVSVVVYSLSATVLFILWKRKML